MGRKKIVNRCYNVNIEIRAIGFDLADEIRAPPKMGPAIECCASVAYQLELSIKGGATFCPAAIKS